MRSLQEHKGPAFDLFKSPQQTEQQGVHATGTSLPRCLGRSLDEPRRNRILFSPPFPPSCASLCVHSDGTSNRLVNARGSFLFAGGKASSFWTNGWHRNKRRSTSAASLAPSLAVPPVLSPRLRPGVGALGQTEGGWKTHTHICRGGLVF